MGLHLKDMHSPTLESGTNGTRSNGDQDNIHITDLIRQKDDLENEMKALGSVLESHGVTMSTPLLTPDGFPRADLDIAQIRTTRARIIHLQTDHKNLMARIEPKMYEWFATNRQPTPPPPSADTNLSSISATAPDPAAANASISVGQQPTTQPSIPAATNTPGSSEPQPRTASGSGAGSGAGSDAAAPLPFALVNSITPSSPAETAGLKVGDKILQFGEANWLNHDKLSLVARIVGQSEGTGVLVVVSRQEPLGVAQLRLTLVPRTGWGGRGALGCHLLPL